MGKHNYGIYPQWVYTHCSALKKSEILTHSYNMYKPKDIMLNGVSQSQKDKCCFIPFI